MFHLDCMSHWITTHCSISPFNSDLSHGVWKFFIEVISDESVVCWSFVDEKSSNIWIFMIKISCWNQSILSKFIMLGTSHVIVFWILEISFNFILCWTLAPLIFLMIDLDYFWSFLKIFIVNSIQSNFRFSNQTFSKRWCFTFSYES